MDTVVKADLFSAAARFTSTEETRYYLNGIHIEPHKQGGATLTAADGHRLFCGYDPAATGVPDSGVIVKPPRPNMLAKWFKAGYVRLTSNTATLHATHADDPAIDVGPATLIEGVFPSWRSLIPRHPSGTLPPDRFFHPRHLMDFQEIGERLQGSQKSNLAFSLEYNGVNPAIVHFTNRNDCFGILMPIRYNTETSKIHWI